MLRARLSGTASYPGSPFDANVGTDKVYDLKTRVNGRQRWFTIGKHGAPWTPDTARRHAVGMMGEIARGGDPSNGRLEAKDLTVDELVKLFLAEHVERKRKASTASLYRDILNRLVLPKLGKRIAKHIKNVDIAGLHHDLHETPHRHLSALGHARM